MKHLLIIGLVVVLLLAGCGSNDKNDVATPSIQPDLSAQQILQNASPKLDDLSSFHFELTQKGGGTPIAKGIEMTGAEGDIAPPDRLKMKVEGTISNQFIEVEVVTVGDQTWMTNPLNGKWTELTGKDDFNALTLFNPGTGIKAVMESVTDAIRINEEKIDDASCFHLRGSLLSDDLDAIASGKAAEGLPVAVDIWIGVDDLLLRKVVFDGQIHEDENEGILRTLTLSKFDQPVDIAAPE